MKMGDKSAPGVHPVPLQVMAWGFTSRDHRLLSLYRITKMNEES